MSILDKVFGKSSKSEEDNRWAIFLNLCTTIIEADGVVSDSEIGFSRSYCQKKAPHLNNSDWDRIAALADSLGPEGLVKAQKLSESDKIELIDYLMGIAISDNDFSSQEAARIIMIAVAIGVEKGKCFDMLMERGVDLVGMQDEIMNTLSNEYINKIKKNK